MPIQPALNLSRGFCIEVSDDHAEHIIAESRVLELYVHVFGRKSAVNQHADEGEQAAEEDGDRKSNV